MSVSVYPARKVRSTEGRLERSRWRGRRVPVLGAATHQPHRAIRVLPDVVNRIWRILLSWQPVFQRECRYTDAVQNIDPHRVGMLGFSAGGAVVNLIAYEKGDGDPNAADPIDRLNGRPDFQMLVYPGGKVPDNIKADAPPAFLLVANDDDYGCDKITLELFTKLRAAGVPVEAIFLAQGRHAFNMGDRSKLVTVRTWPQRMADWLSDSGHLTVKSAM